MDLLGTLVESNRIDEDEVVNQFGDSLIKTWTVLQNWIKLERKNSPKVYRAFEQITNKAASHWRWNFMIREGVEISTEKNLIVLDFHSSAILQEKPTKR